MTISKAPGMRRLAAVLCATAAAAGIAACGSSTTVVTQTSPASGSGTGTGSASTPSTSSTGATTGSVPTTTAATTTGAGTPATRTTASTTTSSGAGACTASDLKLGYLGGQGATGHGELGFSLTNTGSSPCHTYGYPGIQFQSSGGTALPTNSQRTTQDFFGSLPEKTVTIAPGEQASFRVGVTHVAQGADSAKGCTTAAQLQVIPPDDTHSLVITLPDGGSYECATATVSPVQPGTSAFH